MANTMTIDDTSAVLRAVLSQATGRTDLAALASGELLTIAQKAVAQNTEPVLKAISQVLTRTIFSIRPYTAKFAQLRRTPEEFGNYVRKIRILDKETDVDKTAAYELKEGSAVDQYQVDNTKALEMNFVGQQSYTITKTLYDTQFNTAFNSMAEVGSFFSMILTYVNNKIEKIHEETARATVVGFAAQLCKENTANRVIHLLTEYTAETGIDVSGKKVYAPDVLPDFCKWVYARIETISHNLTEYTKLYQTNLSEGSEDQHTPISEQMGFFYRPFFTQVKTRVRGDVFHEDVLSLFPGADFVNFWQSANTPAGFNVKDVRTLEATGALSAPTAVSKPALFGVIADREAMGYTPILDKVTQSPYNARGEYRNCFWHFNERNWIDPMCKGVVLLLD